MNSQSLPTLCGQKLRDQRHVCAIFSSREEARHTISEYLVEGYRRGHMALAMVNPSNTDETVSDLRAYSLDIDEATASGRFALKTWHDTYFKHGSFSAEGMIQFVDASMRSARDAGHSCVWATGDMNWASSDTTTAIDLIEYEARLNHLKPRFGDDVWVCFYDSNLFSGRVIADIIRAHPVVLLGKHVFENPCYTEPDVLVKELEQWKRKLEFADEALSKRASWQQKHQEPADAPMRDR